MHPKGPGEPSPELIPKILDFFVLKVEEQRCGPGEVINIRSALASVYKRKFNRFGEWSVVNGNTKASPPNNVMVQESFESNQIQKKSIGFKRALLFTYASIRK